MGTMTGGIRVAYQGEPGAFSEGAARGMLGAGISGVPCRTFEEMFAAVVRGDAVCCVAPIENSLAGSIHRNYDLLLETELTISGETNVRIVHHLIAGSPVAVADLRRVYSHPVALAQCAKFLAAHPHVEAVPVHDTAGAVRMVVQGGRSDEAAIASAEAAAIHGGSILASGVEDDPQNFTRFLLMTRHEAPPLIETPRKWKTSIVFRLPNKPGSLFRALGAFALLDIDLAKIESRPVQGKPWEYSFYLDLIGASTEPHVVRALDNLTNMAEMVKVLGSYPTRW